MGSTIQPKMKLKMKPTMDLRVDFEERDAFEDDDGKIFDARY